MTFSDVQLSEDFMDIVNHALTAIGEDTIDQFTTVTGATVTGTGTQKIIQARIDKVVKKVLGQYPWQSASAWKLFSSSDDATVPTGQNRFAVAYTLPSDFVRLAQLPAFNGCRISNEYSEIDYEISGGLLLSNFTGAEIKYVQSQLLSVEVVSSTGWSEGLADYIGNVLAHDICYAITGDRLLKQSLFSELSFHFSEACHSEKVTQPVAGSGNNSIRRARWLKARHQ